MKTEYDIIVVGAGLVGLTTALSCAESGASVALLDRREITAGTDSRVSALSTTSLRLFKNLGVDIAGASQPIRDMLVTDGEPNSPWRLHFEGGSETEDEIDLGAVIENPLLKAALIQRLDQTDAIDVFAPASVENFETDTGGVSVDIGETELRARLLIAADGRDSSLRKQAGITVQRFNYDASSLVTLISHEHPHDGLAWQRLIKGGALAVLPLTGHRSQIVWSGPTHAITAACALADADFIALLAEKMDGYLGDMQCTAPRKSYPLRLQVADSFSAGRVALAGDAAHVIHPLAGQGLNLGLRDAAALAAGVQSARDTGQDIGVAGVLDYGLWRNTDTRAFGALTHALSQSSASEMGPIGHIRRLGLSILNRSPAAKSALKKRAAGEAQDLPDLLK